MNPDSTSAMRQLSLTLCALLLAAGQAFGQEEVLLKGKFLALRQAVELGLKQHPAVQEAQAQVQAADARIKQTQSLYYPQVYANANTVAGAGRMQDVHPAWIGRRSPKVARKAAGRCARSADLGKVGPSST